MCGIVGYVGHREVVPLLMDGLRRLEYRGYDSAGVVAVAGGELRTLKAEGKLDRLREKLIHQPLPGHYGLGHTRWATHGPPSERNAHPMVDSRRRLALIHNGIIENFLPLKKRLLAEGWTFSSDTDTEVVANLISSYLNGSLREAVARACAELEGMYAFAVVAADGAAGVAGDGDGAQEIVAARLGPPLVIGLAQGEQYLSSDPTALLAHTRDVIFLENGDLASLRPSGVRVWDRAGRPVERPVQHLNWDPVQAEKGGYKHFMLKEIHEQTQAVQDTLGARVDFENGRILLDTVQLPASELRRLDRLHLLACGTSWHAALIGKFLIEQIARLPVEVDYGSEYRYRDPIVDDRVLAVGISQSGETADTISAMETARDRGAHLFCVCNVQGSQATRISEGVIYTHAGPEIGVASTKAFTTQLVALYLLALYLRQARQDAFTVVTEDAGLRRPEHALLRRTVLDRYGRTLDAADADRYIAEMVKFAELVGVPAQQVPASVVALQEYIESVEPLRATPAALHAIAVVLDPPGLGDDMRELWHDIGQVAIGTLPGWARSMYGFGKPDPEFMERERVRQLIGALDLGYESLPGVMEARERIELRMRR